MPDLIPRSDDAFDQFITVDLGPAINNPGNPLHLTPAQISETSGCRSRSGDWQSPFQFRRAITHRPSLHEGIASRPATPGRR